MLENDLRATLESMLSEQFQIIPSLIDILQFHVQSNGLISNRFDFKQYYDFL